MAKEINYIELLNKLRKDLIQDNEINPKDYPIEFIEKLKIVIE